MKIKTSEATQPKFTFDQIELTAKTVQPSATTQPSVLSAANIELILNRNSFAVKGVTQNAEEAEVLEKKILDNAAEDWQLWLWSFIPISLLLHGAAFTFIYFLLTQLKEIQQRNLSTEVVERLEGHVEDLLQWTQQHDLIERPPKAAAATRPETIVEDQANEI